MFWKPKRKSSSWKRPSDREVRELQATVDKLQAQLDAERCTNEVLTVENQKLAAVVARDLERVKMETAIAARRRAEHEGLEGLMKNDQRAY